MHMQVAYQLPGYRNMNASRWFKHTRANGWAWRQDGSHLKLTCATIGCNNSLTLPLFNLGDPPEPCDKRHVGQYAGDPLDTYESFVQALVSRRHTIGLSQEEVCDAAGLADGHISKIEAYHRLPQFPTLQLWANSLGYEITLTPTALPRKTQALIERRAKPYRIKTQGPKENDKLTGHQ